ncbi:addiction module protein [Planctomyces sp. SH-PL14]|uniref:addiction module protein n=1 Tax=Planctomyces sp. SH-PL14 TaxID=1632864 RepID=UPI00078DB778|nr:addiction module protein [Planctomyces sp. SH-PL14]AMV19539.1 Putative addiction module component [Planctomyces sp. SH-PL14]
MPISLETLLSRLSTAERLELIDRLWAEIEEESLPSLLSAQQQADLLARRADHEAHPDQVLSWETVKAEMEARLP